MTFELPNLDYNYNELEPHIDAKTMEIHHSKHHAAYVSKLNAAIEGKENTNVPIEAFIHNLDQNNELNTPAIRNNGGGHANHSLFWKILTPNGNQNISSDLENKINQTFGSLDQFKEKFNQAAATRFGSGWAWLVKNSNNELEVLSTPNQDNPLMFNKTPLLGLDVWEHAYYLNYQNRRPDYINAFWNLVNWETVSENHSN